MLYSIVIALFPITLFALVRVNFFASSLEKLETNKALIKLKFYALATYIMWWLNAHAEFGLRVDMTISYQYLQSYCVP